jgi:hypothetical protein
MMMVVVVHAVMIMRRGTVMPCMSVPMRRCEKCAGSHRHRDCDCDFLVHFTPCLSPLFAVTKV